MNETDTQAGKSTIERCQGFVLTAGRLLLPVCCVAMVACDAGVGRADPAPPASSTSLAVAATVLHYQEQEGNTEPYPTRIIVTDDYLRLDYGRDDDDFVLLDRRRRELHSTNREDRSILVIRQREYPVEPPMPLALSVRGQELAEAPAIQGLPAMQHALMVNGETCYQVVAVEGLLQPVVEAMQEYRLVLASEHRRILDQVPADAQEPCDLAHNVFWPQRQLEFGLPIQEWDGRGYRRSLIGFETDIPVRDGWFSLPADYQPFYMDVE